MLKKQFIKTYLHSSFDFQNVCLLITFIFDNKTLYKLFLVILNNQIDYSVALIQAYFPTLIWKTNKYKKWKKDCPHPLGSGQEKRGLIDVLLVDICCV